MDAETWAIIGDPSWTDYTIRLRARKLGGREGFIVICHAADGDNLQWWNIGGWDNTVTRTEAAEEGARGPYGDSSDFTVETGRWYDLRLEVTGDAPAASSTASSSPTSPTSRSRRRRPSTRRPPTTRPIAPCSSKWSTPARWPPIPDQRPRRRPRRTERDRDRARRRSQRRQHPSRAAKSRAQGRNDRQRVRLVPPYVPAIFVYDPAAKDGAVIGRSAPERPCPWRYGFEAVRFPAAQRRQHVTKGDNPWITSPKKNVSRRALNSSKGETARARRHALPVIASAAERIPVSGFLPPLDGEACRELSRTGPGSLGLAVAREG